MMTSILAMVESVSKASPVQAALLATIPVYLIIASGWLSRRARWVTPEMDSGFMRIAIDLCFPCFVLDKMLGNSLLKSPIYSLSAMGLGAGIFILSVAVALLIGKSLRLKVGDGLRTFGISAALQNYGFLVIPMIVVLYPAANDPTMGVLLTHNVGVEAALWTVGLIVMSEMNKFSFKLLLRGPIIATILGLFLVWTGFDQFVPQFMKVTFNMLGNCAIPLSIFLVGTCFYDLWGKSRWCKRVAVGSVVTRCMILPVCILALAYFLPIDIVLKRVLVFQAAVPSAILPIVLARHFGGQPNVAIEVVLCTTIASLVTLPLWLSVGFNYVAH